MFNEAVDFGYLSLETVVIDQPVENILGSLSKLTRQRSTGKSLFKFRVMDVKGRLNSFGLEFFRTEICRLAAAASICLSSLFMCTKIKTCSEYCLSQERSIEAEKQLSYCGSTIVI